MYQSSAITLKMTPNTIMLVVEKRAWASRSWSAVILSALGARVWSANQDTSTRFAYHTWNRMLSTRISSSGSHHQEARLRSSPRVLPGSRKILTRLPKAEGLDSFIAVLPKMSVRKGAYDGYRGSS